jgi:hypothetical protein
VQFDRGDAILEIEFRMGERRPFRGERLADVQRDARIPLAAVPVAPVAVEIEQQRGQLLGSGFDFLQADDVRALARDPFLNLRVSRPDTVDVPGGDLQNRACAAWRSAAGTAMMSACAAT